MFFGPAMAGLELYRPGGYGQIGVYRVKVLSCFIGLNLPKEHQSLADTFSLPQGLQHENGATVSGIETFVL